MIHHSNHPQHSGLKDFMQKQKREESLNKVTKNISNFCRHKLYNLYARSIRCCELHNFMSINNKFFIKTTIIPSFS